MRGQIRKRRKSWAVVLYLGTDKSTGRKRYKWYTHKTLREAEMHLSQLLTQVQAGSGVPPSRLLLRDYLDQWLRDDVAGRLAPTTEEIYAYAIRRHLAPSLGHIPIGLSAPGIQGCLNSMLSRGLSPGTVHQVYRSLNTALNTAVRWGLLLRNPCAHVKPPRVNPRTPTIWDEEQLRLFLAEAKRSSRYYQLYLTIVLTGMRPGEALALRWPSVDRLAGQIAIHEKFYRLGRRQLWGTTKTNRQYAVPIPQVLVEELRQHREDQGRQMALLRKEYQDDNLVFCQPNGRPLHERNIERRDFRRVTKRAGLPRIRLYDLRHCCASHLADQGTPVHIVQRQLGHSSPTVTLRYYIHPLRDAQQAVDKLAARLLGPNPGAGNSRE